MNCFFPSSLNHKEARVNVFSSTVYISAAQPSSFNLASVRLAGGALAREEVLGFEVGNVPIGLALFRLGGKLAIGQTHLGHSCLVHCLVTHT